MDSGSVEVGDDRFPLGAVLVVVAAVLAPATAGDMPFGSPAGQSRAANGSSTAKIVEAATAFLGTLDAKQRRRASLELTDTTRANWSNLPTGTKLQSGATERNGVKLGELTAPQQEAALALVAAPLSKAGYDKVMNIVAADQLLEERAAPGRQSSVVSDLAAPSITSRFSVRRRRPPDGWCSSAAITSRSISRSMALAAR